MEPSDLKLRPIVAGPIYPRRPLSNSIDIILKPFLLHVKSYVKDNLLSKCPRENYEDIEAVAQTSSVKKRLWSRCFPVNFAKFLRTPFFTEHLWWLLLER